MATSGVTTFNVNAQQICTRAAATIKIIDTSNGEVLDTNTYNDFLLRLNLITKETMAIPGVLPWARRYVTLFTQLGQNTYFLSSTTSDNWTNTSGVVTTSLNNGYGAGVTSIQVASIVGLASGQNIGIKLNTGATYWTTINGAPSGSTVVLTAGLPSAANAGAFVYAYTTKADRPQKILEMTRTNGILTTQQDTIMDSISLQQYMILPNKNQVGTPLQWNFANKIPQAELKIWQPSDGVSGWDRLSCLCDVLIQDFVSTTDNPDFPVEWSNYLIFKLAYEMSFEYPVSREDRMDIKAEANEKLNMLLNYSSELAEDSLQFGLLLVGK